MRIKVLAFAGFREALGKERELDVRDGATVGEALQALAESLPRFKEEAFEQSGAIRDYVLLMVNRKRIDPLQDLSRRLQDGDELAVFPPVAGG
ncbi:MAG TPA: MoaD/ThiS family protein [Methanothrix sp.]|jgi:molybdopterin synthase sulfur carrier subunit|nr:MoaD/ThiS family protein [Methanothrix sp.]HOV81193.1 MoaD/ThiS family protein [Methanothrix sp.]HPC88996.1 MoaD/ThiS family protein [Methanothrix sp.]HQE86761.1 MoaD/ThiS family protein [Methanothrix sp.]HQI67390.1 MoaD/ThiS family protein [Methanothrix sp.]